MRKSFAVIALPLLVWFISGCADKGPVASWPPPSNSVPSPTIRSISPPSAGPGVFDITIQGDNFGSSPSQLFVYFGSLQVNVASATTNQITFPRPNVVGDSISVRVIVQNADLPATYPKYSISQVSAPFGAFIPSSVTSAVASDDSGNVYVVFDNTKTITKISRTGVMTDLATFSITLSASGIHVGRDGSVYLQMAFKKDLYRVAPGGGTATRLLSFLDAVNYFDFDQNGNIYAGGARRTLNIAHADNSVARGPDYSSYIIWAVRVVQNYVYVLAEKASGDTTVAASGVYRHQIKSADGTLGAAELILAWNATGTYATSKFKDIAFSADGEMFIATDNSDPILMVSSGGQMRPLYTGILTTPAVGLAWAGTTLYELLGGSKLGLMSIAMGKAGATNFSR